jgi:DNA-directed RNA polymerase subunit RPC12/RpoP
MYPTLVILLVLAIFTGVSVYLFVRSRRQETFLHIHCSNCGKRLIYKARQVGLVGACPRCGHKLTAPSTAGK